jgi:hypothetical protein
MENFGLERDLKVFYKSNFFEEFIVSSKIPFFFCDNSFLKFGSYICSVFFDFLESKYFFVLDFGLKARMKFSLRRIRLKYPRRLINYMLFFWHDVKFLVFNSFNLNNVLSLYVDTLFYNGYFPFNYFNSIFSFCYGLLDRFSFASFIVLKNILYPYKRYFSSDLDFHISNSLGRGITIPVYFGYIIYFRFFVNEYYLITGELDIFNSWLINSFDFGKNKKTVYGFFRSSFFFKYLSTFKTSLFQRFFSNGFFSYLFYAKFIRVLQGFLVKGFYVSFKRFAFFRFLMFFSKLVFLIKFMQFFFLKFTYFYYFFFELILLLLS